MKDSIYYVGLTVIMISFIVCVLSYYLLVFGIPIFLIGVICVFLSNQSINKKLRTTLLPIIIYFPATFGFLYVYNYSTPKIVLIPENLEGELRVIYKEKCGQNYEYTQGMKTLTFPENGILILNEDFDRHVNFKYYLLDSAGNKTQVPQIFHSDERHLYKSCVLVENSGTISQPIHANSININEEGITYTNFYLFNNDSVYKTDYQSQSFFDSLAISLVNKCRNKGK